MSRHQVALSGVWPVIIRSISLLSSASSDLSCSPPPPLSLPSLPPLFASQEHIDTAISLNPSDPTLYYLRGRWEYEVAGLSWLEKKAAAALYATPPESTFDEALGDFMQVESLNGGGTWKVNLMMIGKVSCPPPPPSDSLSICL